LNVERSRFDKVISSQEIRNIITALGTSIGPKGASVVKLENLRYHKVVIMTDADVEEVQHKDPPFNFLLPPDAGAHLKGTPLHGPTAPLRGENLRKLA
jgi:hypothetical protein